MITVQNINEIDNIISRLRAVEDSEAWGSILAECVEDPALFVKVMGKYKNARPKKRRDTRDMFARTDTDRSEIRSKYNKDDVLDEFMHTSEEQLKDKYSLNELQSMYEAVYRRHPTSNYTKNRIIDTVRGMAFTIARAKAFGEMAKMREMKSSSIKTM